MAVKLVLTQIMKNESHIAKRMLDSIKPIVDALCIVDTGSTDNSVEVVKKWGLENNVETYVFERSFDNFENCRNYAFDKAREIFLNRDSRDVYYGFWLDFDEQIVVEPNFRKQSITKDLYMFNTYIKSMKYTRNELCRLDKPFRFYGPVHEYIVCDDRSVTSGLLDGLKVIVNMDGASWKEDVSEKYKKHAILLEDYITNKDKNARWIFYTAQSYHDSSNVPNNRKESEERLRRSIYYYRERIERQDGYEEERFYSQYRIGTIMRALEMPWRDTMEELLKAYSMDPMRCEPIKTIIDYYLSVGEYNLAYIYSKFAKVTYHGKSPYPKRLLFVDESLYNWRILEVHAAACFYSNRKEEAKANFEEILAIQRTNPGLFSEEDIRKIDSNKGFFLK